MNNQNMQKYCCILENENGVERVFYNDKITSPHSLKISTIYNLLCERLEILEDKLAEFAESMLDSKYGDLCKYLTSDNVHFIKISTRCKRRLWSRRSSVCVKSKRCNTKIWWSGKT
jgi:hypothetical protein